MTLRALAGLLGPDAGPGRYGAEAVKAFLTEDRHIGYVPQTLALFPHRTVWQQLVFAADADPQVAAWWLTTLHLDGLEDRLPHQLSGGSANGSAWPGLSAATPGWSSSTNRSPALDAPVREELRRELRRLQYETGLSTVLVTHDPEEAALLADEIIVIADGQLLQAGTRQEVYTRPAVPAGGRAARRAEPQPGPHRLDDRAVGRVRRYRGAARTAAGTDVLWCVRPERIEISDAGRYPGGGRRRGRPRGRHRRPSSGWSAVPSSRSARSSPSTGPSGRLPDRPRSRGDHRLGDARRRRPTGPSDAASPVAP